MKPYGLISDTHNHSWSAFATVGEDGVNSRLRAILDETKRCAKEVRNNGGDTIIHAGDLFHVRGSIAPSVLNPTKDCYRDLIKDGFKIVILAGNHDLEGKEANRLFSAVTALEDIGCKIINTAQAGLGAMEQIVFIPWTPNIADLKKLIADAAAADPKGPSDLDLILHAPIDGVIEGIPDHGLSPEWLAEQGFRRVFAGHYHHHRHLYDGARRTYSTDVYSIGALTHQTWSDVDSKAGFLIAHDDAIQRFASHAPSFVEIDEATAPEEIPLIVDGNYVRAKINSTKQKDVEELRAYLTDCGAEGVVILAQKESSVAKRDGSTVTAGASMEVSVADFIKSKSYANPEKLAVLCQEILTSARSAA